MEGTESQTPNTTTTTTKMKTSRRSVEVDNDERDSGCERSPTNLSPSGAQYKASAEAVRTYGRDFLLSLQFSALALNPKPEEILWHEYDNTSQYGVFNEKVCHYKKEDREMGSAKKEMSEGSFFKHYPKTGGDSGADLLRPQRKSFVSGCQMRTINSESNLEKQAEGGGVGGQERNRERNSGGENNKDRPRSVPTVERGGAGVDAGGRRVGSGRLNIERTDGRPDSRGSGSGREKPVRQHSSADKADNWRSREPPSLRPEHEEEQENRGFTNHRPDHREPRGEPRNNRRELHRGNSGYVERNQYTNQRHGHHQHYHEESEPEWFSEQICMTDTIELKGFDGHKEKADKRDKKEREKKERKDPKNKENSDKKPTLSTKVEKLGKEKAGNPAENKNGSEQNLTGENLFDFDTFMDTIQMSGLNDSSNGSMAESTASRFSRWFKAEDHQLQDLSSAFPPPVSGAAGADNSSAAALLSSDELHVDTHMSSIVQDLLSPLTNDLTPRGASAIGIDSLLDSPPPPPTPTAVISESSPRGGTPGRKKEGGSRILHMLQNAAAKSAASSPSAHNVEQPKPSPRQRSEETSNQLPAALTKLLSSPAASRSSADSAQANKPGLPAKFKTLEELEAGLQTQSTNRAETATKDTADHHHKHSHKHHHHHHNHPHNAAEEVHQHHPQKPGQPKQEMAAFNKLLGMLQVTGELKTEIPRMPEVTNTETPTQLRKHQQQLSATGPDGATLSQAELDQVERGSPILPNPQQQKPPSQPSNLVASQPPQQQALLPNPTLNNSAAGNMGPISQPQSNMPLLSNQIPAAGMRNTPPNVMTGLPGGLMPNPGLMPGHPATGMIPPVMLSQPQRIPQPSGLAAAVQASAFQGPAAMNPLLQQAMHQRQKLPSPIMFGAQPPEYIVAPAAIHPGAAMPPPTIQQILSRQPQANTAMSQQSAQPVMSSQQQMMVSQQSAHALPPAKPATVSSMAFTPTSVLRKHINDKVDRNMSDSHQLKQMLDSIQPNNEQSRQQFSSNQPTMRAIVKNNGPSVAEQMLSRQIMMEQQNAAAMMHQQHQQQQMSQFFHHHQQQQQSHGGHSMFQQHQQQAPPPQANMFSQSLNPPQQQHNQNQHNPGMGPPVSPIQALQHQLAFIQQAQHQQQQQSQQQQMNVARALRERLSPENNITRWFCGAELAQQGGLPQIPKQAAILKLEDLEN